MKNLLCFESSADPTVIGVVRDETLLVEHVFSDRDEFANMVAQALRDVHLPPPELTGIAIGIGPGSFTGLRVSLAFAKGMARGLSIPVYPISSLKVLAANLRHETERIGAITHARRNQVHFAICHGVTLEFLDGPRVVTHEELLSLKAEMSVLIGPGVKHLGEHLRDSLSNLIPSDDELHRPRALTLAQLAREVWKDKVPPEAGSLVPEYGLEFGA